MGLIFGRMEGRFDMDHTRQTLRIHMRSSVYAYSYRIFKIATQNITDRNVYMLLTSVSG